MKGVGDLLLSMAFRIRALIISAQRIATETTEALRVSSQETGTCILGPEGKVKPSLGGQNSARKGQLKGVGGRYERHGTASFRRLGFWDIIDNSLNTSYLQEA